MSGEPFRWHVLSECQDETACPVHGLNNEMTAIGDEDGAVEDA